MTGSRHYRFAGAQIRQTRDIRRNGRKIIKQIERAGKERVDFLVFPEMALTGYHGEFDMAERNGALVEIVAAVKEARVAILLGTGDELRGRRTIQVRAYSKKGRLIGTHDKTIPTDNDMKWCTRGWGPRVYEHEGLVFGCLICNDFWANPQCRELPDVNLPAWLAFLGAEVIFHSICSGSGEADFPFHMGMLDRRARENGLYVVTANAAFDKPVNAPSGVIGPDGKWIVQVDRAGEGMYVQEIELAAKTARPGR